MPDFARPSANDIFASLAAEAQAQSAAAAVAKRNAAALGRTTRPRIAALTLWLAVAIALGTASFVYIHTSDAMTVREKASAHAIQLDHEISRRLYAWLAQSEMELPSSDPVGFFGRLLKSPAESEAAQGLAADPAFAARGLLSLVLELQTYVDDATASRLDGVISALIFPDTLLADCASLRECTGVVALTLMLDRWRQ